MSFQIFVPIIFIILYFQNTACYSKDDVNNCIDNSNCRDVLQWSLHEKREVYDPKTCLMHWESVSRKLQGLWPRTAGTSESRFRKYGESCNPGVENKFYQGLLNISMLEPLDVAELQGANVSEDIGLSYNWYMDAFGQHFKSFFTEHELRLQICDPRWLLMCDHSSAICRCIDSKYLQHSPSIQAVKNIPKLQVGTDHEKKHSNISYPDESYRCFPRQGAACEVNLAFVGMCTTDCQWGQECFEGEGDDNKKFKRCCSSSNNPDSSKRNCTGKAFKANSGNDLKASTSAFMLFLICALISTLRFCL